MFIDIAVKSSKHLGEVIKLIIYVDDITVFMEEVLRITECLFHRVEVWTVGKKGTTL